MKPSSRAARLALVALALGVPAMALAQDEDAEYLEIHEFSLGTPDAPGAQYVVVHLKDAHDADMLWVEVRDASGTLLGGFGEHGFAPMVATGYFAMGNADARAHYDLDFLGSTEFATIPSDGGRLCVVWDDDIWYDCVTFGAYDDGSDEYGTPAPIPGLGQALTRVSRTGDSATDFSLVTADPSPYADPIEEEEEPEGPGTPVAPPPSGGGDLPPDTGCATGPGTGPAAAVLLILGALLLALRLGRRRVQSPYFARR